MRALWWITRWLRFGLLIAVAFFFAMSMVYVDTPDGRFEIYIELFLGAFALALMVGYLERKMRLRAARLGELPVRLRKGRTRGLFGA